MTATDLATQPERQPSKPFKVTGKLSEAINRMIEQGEDYQTAAAAVGLHVRAMRKALDKAHVLNEMRRRKHVFRASISSANIHRLARLRDQDENKMAALGAIKTLEQIEETDGASPARQRAPGVTIIIAGAAPQTTHLVQNDAKPLIDHDAVLHPHNEQGGNGDE